MSDTIRRDAAIEAICSVCQIEHSASCKYKEGKYGGCEEIEAIKSIPAADYVNNHTEDEPSDREALDILLGGNTR